MRVSTAVSRIVATLIFLAAIASAFGYELVHMNNASAVTETEMIVTSYTDNYGVIISGTCTGRGGTISVNSATTTTLGTSTYSTSVYGNFTTTYISAITSQNMNDIPSYGWTVTTCTLSS